VGEPAEATATITPRTSDGACPSVDHDQLDAAAASLYRTVVGAGRWDDTTQGEQQMWRARAADALRAAGAHRGGSRTPLTSRRRVEHATHRPAHTSHAPAHTHGNRGHPHRSHPTGHPARHRRRR